jgi:hypothetical protein
MTWLPRLRSSHVSADGAASSGRFGVRPLPARRRAGLAAAAALGVAMLAYALAFVPSAERWADSLRAAGTAAGVAAVAAFLTWLILPGLARLTRQELARRRQLFHIAYRNAFVDPTAESVGDLLATQAELELSDEEVGGERAEVIRATLELFAFDEQIRARGGQLPPVPGYEAAGPERCVFTADVLMQQGSTPERGRLLFTAADLLFHGRADTRIPWNEIAGFRRDGAWLIVQGTNGGPRRIALPTLAAAMRAEYIAGALRAAMLGSAVV